MDKHNMVIIGSSGASLPILNLIFKDIPKLHGTIILIQHMPIYINQAVCDHLAVQTEMIVKIAEFDELIKPGILYVAPSEVHLKLIGNKRVQLDYGDKVNFVCPSIDVAMMSLVKQPNSQPMGILLSGVGDDGIKGISHIKKLSGITIALEKSANSITDMADEAIATGHVDLVLNPKQIHDKLIEHLGIDKK